jgi:hypothetical protein
MIVNELVSTSEDIRSEVLQFIKSIKHQHQKASIALSNTPRRRIANLEQGKIVMSDDFNGSLPDAFWLGVDE